MNSEAYKWLPHFARSVVFAVASRYRGNNNGGLELTVKTALDQGISKGELYAGLKLACMSSLLHKTCESKRSHGKGIPAKYCITWKPLDEFPSLNLKATKSSSDDWIEFKPVVPRLRSLTSAEVFLGWRNRDRKSRSPTYGGDSIEVSETSRSKKDVGTVTSQMKTKNESGTTQTSGSGTSQTKKN